VGRVAIHRSDRCREQPDLRHRRRQAYNWDSRKRLTLITGVASFLYDGLNRRESITQGGTTKAYLYDGLNPVQEQQGGSVFANLLTGLGIDKRFTRTTGGVTSTFLTDLLGSTMALTNSSGVIQTSYAYGPYGGVTVTGASNSNTYQYAGRENDGTGLDYYRARYYKPSYGRFISEDQIGLNGGSNLYAYAGGNPVNYNDPTGNFLAPTPSWWDVLDLDPVVAAATILLTPTPTASDDTVTSCKPNCPPCTPYSEGTIGYIGPHQDDHFNKYQGQNLNPHLNLFNVNQDKSSCKCFWNKSKPNDSASPPPLPGWVDLNNGFPPLSP